MNGLRFSIVLATVWTTAPAMEAGVARAEEAAFLHPATSSGHPVSSRSQHYVFRGFDARDGIALGRWVEDVTDSLAGWVGYPAPFRRLEMVRINAEGESVSAAGTLLMGQGLVDSLFQQQLVVVRPEVVTEEALLEGFVQVLLNRYVVHARTKRSPAIEDIVVPDWLTVGVAQSLNPRLRNRNRTYVRDRWRNERPPTVADILSWQTLPPRRTGEKAACGLFLQWWREQRGRDAGWPSVFGVLAKGDVLTASWVTVFLVGEDGIEGDMEAAWQAWADDVAAGEILVWSELDMDRVIAFKRRLEIDVRAFGLQPIPGLGYQVEAGDLLERRHESWVRIVARAMVGEMQRVAASSPPHLGDVAHNYGQYFRAFVPGANERPMTQKALGLLLEKAGEGLVQLEKEVVLRHHFLDETARRAEGGGESAPTASESNLEELRRRFLDTVQERVSAP